MRRADRLFQIIQLLRGRALLTAEQLAEKLSVSKRTIYRDVQDLQASGVPVRGEAGMGYCLEAGYELPPMTFNRVEIEALVLGARVAEVWGDPELAAAAQSAITKIEAVLPRLLRKSLADTALFVPDTPWAPAASAGLGVIRQAIANRRKLRLEYQRGDGERSDRIVRPVGLYFWGRTWSLAAWCELREGWRNFRVDRIQIVEAMDDHFEESDEISLDAFVKVREAERAACARDDRSCHAQSQPRDGGRSS
ncbi:MAG: YafY family protein [Myxococcota bacterium]